MNATTSDVLTWLGAAAVPALALWFATVRQGRQVAQRQTVDRLQRAVDRPDSAGVAPISRRRNLCLSGHLLVTAGPQPEETNALVRHLR